MKIEMLFYLAGSFFIIAALTYMAYADVFNLSGIFKVIILILFVIIFFLLGIYLRERDL